MAESIFAGRRFHPKPGATIAAGIAFLILIALGIWQIERLGWKENLIAQRQERSTGPAIALPAPGADLADLDFQHARAQGHFDNAHEMYLAARSLNGNPGYHVLTPFDLDDGRVLVVDRGWVPLNRKMPEQRAQGQIEGEVAIEGLIRLQRPQNWLEPDNQPADNMWYWMDLPAMAAHLGLAADKLAPVYLEAGPAPNPGGFPIGGQSRTELPNDHLQYAITWFSLAIALAVIWFLYHWKTPEEERAASQAPGGKPGA